MNTEKQEPKTTEEHIDYLIDMIDCLKMKPDACVFIAPNKTLTKSEISGYNLGIQDCLAVLKMQEVKPTQPQGYCAAKYLV